MARLGEFVQPAFGALLLGLALSMPAGVVAYVLVAQSDVTAPVAPVASSETTGEDDRAVLIGTLYSRGVVMVEWNGGQTPIENSSYAYVGGERMSTGPGDIGVLSLGRAGTVYVCPSSTISVDRRARVFHVSVTRGVSRFSFDSGTPFAVALGIAQVTPLKAAKNGGFVGEAQACENGACQVMALRGDFTLQSGVDAKLDDGHAVSISGPRGTDLNDYPLPADIREGLLSASGGVTADLATGTYLCRVQEVLAYAQLAALPATSAGPAPRKDSPVKAPEIAPAVEPPGIPPLALAPPLPPGAFDPEALPPPAAGPVAAPLTVPAPVIPAVGTGGGGIATES